MHEPLDHRTLYRLPWSLSDNPIAWLEPTQACNLACDGCYRENVKQHKSLDEVQADLDVFDRLRTYDGVSIAGGDPLMHPQIIEIVRMIARSERKPIINTNGLALTEPLLRQLRDAGLVGLTFHIDSKQGRPGWRDNNEIQLCELREQLARMVARVGGLACAFNATVYDDTLKYVPELVDWAARNIDIVQTMVFITFRAAACDAFDYYCGAKKVDMEPLVYLASEKRRTDITSREVVDVIRDRFPDYAPCAYLNGTESPDSFKWLIAMRIGDGENVYGYAGPKFMETVQAGYHVISGRYLSYADVSLLHAGRATMAAGLWDAGLRSAAKRYVSAGLRDPRVLLRPLHMQAVVHIQPIDVTEDGRDSMCDGCPDMTVHEGRLVWSCRLEEPRKFGRFLRAVPRGPKGEGPTPVVPAVPTRGAH